MSYGSDSIMRYLINLQCNEEEALELLHQPRSKVAVDIETVDLQNRLPLGIGIAVSPSVGYYFFDVKDKLAKELIGSVESVIFHNAKFDIPILHALGYTIQGYEDTMMIAYSAGILDNSLESLSRDILGRLCPKITDQWRKKNQGNVSIDHVEMGRICIIHATNTYALEETLPKTDLYHNIDKPSIELLMEIEQNGVLIDQYTLTRVEQSVINKAFSLERELKEELGVNNLGSNPQVAEALKKLGILGTRKTKSAKDSVGEESLKPLNLPLTNKILEWRSLMKTVNTYVPAFRKVDSRGRLHTEFGLTNTGRWKSKKPNLQNITRDEKFATEEED